MLLFEIRRQFKSTKAQYPRMQLFITMTEEGFFVLLAWHHAVKVCFGFT